MQTEQTISGALAVESDPAKLAVLSRTACKSDDHLILFEINADVTIGVSRGNLSILCQPAVESEFKNCRRNLIITEYIDIKQRPVLCFRNVCTVKIRFSSKATESKES